MSNATIVQSLPALAVTNGSSPLDFPAQLDRCPTESCDSVIPRTHVHTDPKRGFTRILCPSCGRVYQVAIKYSGGMAVAAGEIKLIDAERSVTAMKEIVKLRTGG